MQRHVMGRRIMMSALYCRTCLLHWRRVSELAVVNGCISNLRILMLQNEHRRPRVLFLFKFLLFWLPHVCSIVIMQTVQLSRSQWHLLK